MTKIADLVTIHNAELDATSQVKRESLEVWQSQGWTLVPDEAVEPAPAPVVEGAEQTDEATVAVP